MNKLDSIIKDLKWKMKEKKITQVEISEKLKISLPTVNSALNLKNVNVNTLKAIINYIENKEV